MNIQACPRCASRELHMPKFEDGNVPETDTLGDYVCNKCDLKAIPIEFETMSAYLAFKEALQ